MLNSLIVAEEERLKFFILQDFWPTFRLFQICGFFPVTKVIDDNGNFSLQPTKIWKSVMLQLIWMLLLLLPLIGKLRKIIWPCMHSVVLFSSRSKSSKGTFFYSSSNLFSIYCRFSLLFDFCQC